MMGENIARFTVLDTETTAADPAEARLVQYACRSVTYSREKRQIYTHGPMFDALYDPGMPIPPEASGKHHIIDTDVEGCPLSTDAELEIIRSSILDTPAAHNAPYDRAVLKGDDQEGGLRWLDTLRLAKHVFDDLPSYALQSLRYRLLEHPRDVGLAHTAAGDVEVLCQVLEATLNAIDDQVWKTLTDAPGDVAQQLALFAEQPVRLKKMPMGKYFGEDIYHVSRKDPGYLKWLINNIDNPDLVFTCRQVLR